ncbi:MAG: hypothetical protein PHH37_11260 [Paludibacter sp.]|nr:hypothetical protein [Paludibacter sp.]
MGQILVKHGEKSKLATFFGVSLVTIRDALNYKTQSELSRKIREKAIERGGKES